MAGLIPREPTRPGRRRPQAREELAPQPRGGAVRLLAHIGLMVLSGCIAAAAVGGVAYVRISHGPISLKFIARSVERGINAELSGLEARVDDAQVALSPGGGFELRLTDLKFAEPDGDVVASVPTAAVQLSRQALWSMKLVPSRIDLIEPRLYLAYTAASGLSLSFDRPVADAPGDPQPASEPGAAGRAGPASKPHSEAAGISMAAMIGEAAERARKQLGASDYLNEIGVRNAVVTLDNEGVRSEWRVLEGAINLDRQRRDSAATAHATIATDRGPWSLSVQSEDRGAGQGLKLQAGISDLVPGILGTAFPQLRLLKYIDAPVTGQASLELTPAGTVASGALTLGVGRGQVRLPTVADVPFNLETGQLVLSYDGATQSVALAPSTIDWGGSHVTIKGSASLEPSTDMSPAWLFDLATSEGQLSATDIATAPVAIERGTLKGRIVPASGEVWVDEFALKAGSAQLSGTGLFVAGVAGGDGSARFDAKLGPTPAEVLKALWPRSLANGARVWVGQRVKRGTIKSGSMRFVSGSFARDAGVTATASGLQRRLSLAAEAVDIQAVPLKWMPPVEAPRALIQIEDNTIEITVPDSAVVMGPNRRIPVKAGRFASSNLDAQVSISEITYHSTAPLVAVLELLDMSPLHLLKSNGLTSEGVDGKADVQMKLTVPLVADLDDKDVKIEAKAKVIDGKVKQLAGAFDVQGAGIAIEVSEAAVDAKGDMLINGVPVKLGWQRILEDSGEKQPPLRLSANLDNADRTQLGIDVNHILQGEVPAEFLIEKGAQGENSVKLRADLTNADISFESIAWRKPPGRAATLQADIVKGKTYKYDLQNLRIIGDDIAIEGTASISADNRLRELDLPGVQLNVITRLNVHAELKGDGGAEKTGVWAVKLRGDTFDGRDLFRSLFSVGPTSEKAAKPGKPAAGMDLDAEVVNVIGHGEVSLRGVHMKMSRRADKITSLDARGTLDGGAPVAIVMNPQSGEPRRMLADTTDAGQALKLIGFYPNMQNGRARLEVNVDGRGPAEKTGTLWVESFKVLGDPVVSEVLGGALGPGDEPAPQTRARKKVPLREVFEFDVMKVPFAVGYGQFVVENAYLRGPLLGVSLVGKADFKLRTLNLGGTYIPLQGFNGGLRGVPLLGELTAGSKGEGTFGMPFAVQGPMAQPQVLVNPFGFVAPGIFREIFQMTNPNPKVIPREEKGPALPVEQRVRAGAPGGAGLEQTRAAPQAAQSDGNNGAAPDGWSSQITPPGAPATR